MSRRPPSALRQAALADLDGLRARHPAVFRPAWSRRAVVVGSLAAVIGLAVFAMVRLDFSLLRILHGLHRLGELLAGFDDAVLSVGRLARAHGAAIRWLIETAPA